MTASANGDDRVRLKVEVHGLGGITTVTGFGTASDIRQNVLSALSIEQEKKRKDLTEERIQRLHAKAEEEIKAALEPFGFYKPTIQASLTPDGNGFVASYEIEKGPPLKVTRRHIELDGEGATEPSLRELVADFPLSEGDILVHPRYEAGKRSFDDYAADLGYLNAKWLESKVEVDLDAYTAEIDLHYDTGPRFHFGEVRFHQDFLEPKLLAGFVPWARGEPISLRKVLTFQDSLSRTRYFSRVEVEPRPGEATDHEAPVDVTLQPGPKRRWRFGIGYGTDTGIRGSAALEGRRLNRLGHHGEAELKLSVVEKSLALKYLIPGKRPATDSLGFVLGFADFRPDTSKSDTLLAGVAYARELGHLNRTLALTYQAEKYEVGVDEGTSNLLIPEVSATHIVADDRTFTRRGHRARVQIRGAVEPVLADATFLSTRFEGKLIRPLGERGRFLARLDVGYISTSDFRTLPPRIRFFAGGDQSVRGYRFQALGRRDEEGNVIGGETLRVGSVELEHLFIDRWGGAGAAIFVDAGNATKSFGEELKYSFGAGVRWRSPIGFVRVDAALPQGEPGTPIVFHVNIGPDL